MLLWFMIWLVTNPNGNVKQYLYDATQSEITKCDITQCGAYVINAPLRQRHNTYYNRNTGPWIARWWNQHAHKISSYDTRVCLRVNIGLFCNISNIIFSISEWSHQAFFCYGNGITNRNNDPGWHSCERGIAFWSEKLLIWLCHHKYCAK